MPWLFYNGKLKMAKINCPDYLQVCGNTDSHYQMSHEMPFMNSTIRMDF